RFQQRIMTPETIIALDGVEQPISEHALDWGIPASLIIARLNRGWNKRDAIETPANIVNGKIVSDHDEAEAREARREEREAIRLQNQKEREAERQRKHAEREAARQHRLDERRRKQAEREAARERSLFEIDGERRTLNDWAKVSG